VLHALDKNLPANLYLDAVRAPLQERIAGAKGTGTGTEPAQAPMMAPAIMSMLEFSHRAPVTALHWLPGVRISKEGSRPPTVPPSAQITSV